MRQLEGQRDNDRDTVSWVLIVNPGGRSLRVQAGMTVGESNVGALSVLPQDAQLRVESSPTGDLQLVAAPGFCLKGNAGTMAEITLDRTQLAVIRLPNHVINCAASEQVARGEKGYESDSVKLFDLIKADTPVEPPAPEKPERGEPRLEARGGIPLPQGSRRRRSSAPRASRRRERLPARGGIPLPSVARDKAPVAEREPAAIVQMPAQADAAKHPEPAPARQAGTEQPPAPVHVEAPYSEASIRRRRLIAGTVAAMLVGLLILNYGAQPPVPVEVAPIAPDAASEASQAQLSQPSQAEPSIEIPAVATTEPVAEAATAASADSAPAIASAVPPEPDAVVASVPVPASAPAALSESPAPVDALAEPQEVAQPASEPVEPPTAAAPAVAAAAETPVTNAAAPAAAVGVAAAETIPAPSPQAVEQRSTPERRPAPERTTANTARAQEPPEAAPDAGELLSSAEAALEQGRLIAPANANAYHYYNEALKLDPTSEAAQRGLQAVQQGMINRALAQLASQSLRAAQTTLEIADEIGANPQLVADLSSEVEYRLRLADARAGRFNELFPAEQLVAIDQPRPRLRQLPETGLEVRFTVTTRGDVRDIELLANELSAGLERNVIRTVQNWRFEPVLFDGRPLPVRSSVTYLPRN